MRPHQSIFRKLHLATMPLLLALAVTSCEKPDPVEQATPPVDAFPEITDPAVDALTQQAWSISAELLDESLASTQTFNTAIASLLTSPSEETLKAARSAWVTAHNAFQKTIILLMLADTNPGLFGRLADLQFAIDAHPIQPGFIDYFSVYTHSGIVNDIAMPLTADALRQQHGLTDNADVSLGFHALEYLLWGEKGDRPHSDFEATEELTQAQRTAGLRIIDLPNNRRRTLAQLLTNLLEDDLVALRQQWGNLKSHYLSITPTGRVQLWRSATHSWVISTIKQFDAYSAYINNPPEGDEPAPWHSPFADNLNTHSVQANAQALSAQLETLNTILLNTDQGLGRWTLPEEQRDSVITSLATLKTNVEQQEGNWPGGLTESSEEPLGMLLDVLSDEAWQSVGQSEPDIDLP